MKISGMDAAVTLQTNSEPQVVVRDTFPNPSARDNIQQNGTALKDNPVNEKAVSEAVDKMNKALEGSDRRFEYSVHEKTNEIMIKVIDETTGKVIREIPPKKILDMVANMMEMAGLLVDERR